MAEPLSHNLRFVAADLQGRPIAYTCYGQASNRWDPRANIAHMQRLFQDCEGWLRTRGTPLGRWIIVVDFHGYGMADNNPRTGVYASRLLAHFPERLGLAVLYDAPWLFSAAWRVISAALPEETRRKVRFLSHPGAGPAAAGGHPWLEFCDDEAAQWLARECAENRDPRTSHGKRYWRDRGRDAEHDPRGTKTWQAAAGHLLPQYGPAADARAERKGSGAGQPSRAAPAGPTSSAGPDDVRLPAPARPP
jgi:hypothetical protein